MKIFLFKTFFLFLVVLTGCTDSESEALIEGRWEAVRMTDRGNSQDHTLPEGIYLNFEYPRYEFSGETSELGNYYIKNDKLHLIPTDQDEKRELPILKLQTDTLILYLEDSLGSRSVEFLRN